MSSRTGALPNHWKVNPGTKSIAHYLQALGYHVAVFNKVHVGPTNSFPFETVKASKSQPGGGGRTLDFAVIDDWLERQLSRSPEQPLCLFFCDNNTHLAWPTTQHSQKAEIKIPGYLPNSDVTRRSLGRYYTEVELLDDRVGECIKVLQKHTLFDSSLFIFTSDQGPAWLHGKWTLYDLGIHVPFIARWPGHVRSGTVNHGMLSLVDLTPTFVEVAGGKPDRSLDGRSFLATLKEPDKSHRTHVFATHTGDGVMNNYPCRAIRTERYKFIWNLRADLVCNSHLTLARGTDRKGIWDDWRSQRTDHGQIARAMDAYQRRPEFELYDVRADPEELNNLAETESHKTVVARLKGRLQAWMKGQGDLKQDMQFFLDQKKAGEP